MKGKYSNSEVTGISNENKMIKLHVIADGDRIIEIEITGSNVGDSPVFRKMFKRLRALLENMEIKVTVMGDAAYDAQENFSLSRSSPARRKAVLEQRDKDWSKRAGYTKRWRVESIFSALKRLFGEKLSSRKFVYAVREILIMVSLFNIFQSYIKNAIHSTHLFMRHTRLKQKI